MLSILKMNQIYITPSFRAELILQFLLGFSPDYNLYVTIKAKAFKFFYHCLRPKGRS